MLKEDAQRFYHQLFAAYPEVSLRTGTEEAYVRYLSELKHDDVAGVVPDLIRSSPTLPTIAHIRGGIAEVALNLPSPLEAYHSLFEPGAERHPLTRYLADVLGGEYSIRTSEEPGITRAQFLRYFDELRQEAVRRGALPRVVTGAAVRRADQEEQRAEEPSVWRTIRERFDELPDKERSKRLREARRRLLKTRDISPDWLAAPVIEYEALRHFAEQEGWLEKEAS